MPVITLTLEDIQNGKRESCCDCPVAIGLKRAFPDKLISVGQETIEIGDDEYEPSPAVYEFIKAFDQGQPVTPFSFDINDLILLSDEDEDTFDTDHLYPDEYDATDYFF